MRQFRVVGLVSCALVAAVAPFLGCSDDTGETPTDAPDAPSEAVAPETGSDTLDAEPPEPPFDCTSDSAVEAPTHLRCTGLYERWTTKTIPATVREYKPGVVLWSDGADKRRWVFLPPGTKIDTSNMDSWVFPVGTKFWKEFSVGGKRIETRHYWKLAATTWVRTTYKWSADEETAIRTDTGFTENDAGDPDAGGYEIPSVGKCDSCHAGGTDKILGFEPVGLGIAGATGYTLDLLVAESRLTTNPSTTTLSIPEDTHGSANALGWLHANCGTACHNANPDSTCFFKGMNVRLSYAELSAGTGVTGLLAYTTTHDVAATIPSASYKRIAHGDTVNSAIHFLASHRNNTSTIGQMPPIDTHIVDPTGVGYLTTWISALP